MPTFTTRYRPSTMSPSNAWNSAFDAGSFNVTIGRPFWSTMVMPVNFSRWPAGPAGPAARTPEGGRRCGVVQGRLPGAGGAGRAPKANGLRPTSPSRTDRVQLAQPHDLRHGHLARRAAALPASGLDVGAFVPVVRKNWNHTTPPSSTSSTASHSHCRPRPGDGIVGVSLARRREKIGRDAQRHFQVAAAPAARSILPTLTSSTTMNSVAVSTAYRKRRMFAYRPTSVTVRDARDRRLSRTSSHAKCDALNSSPASRAGPCSHCSSSPSRRREVVAAARRHRTSAVPCRRARLPSAASRACRSSRRALARLTTASSAVLGRGDTVLQRPHRQEHGDADRGRHDQRQDHAPPLFVHARQRLTVVSLGRRVPRLQGVDAPNGRTRRCARESCRPRAGAALSVRRHRRPVAIRLSMKTSSSSKSRSDDGHPHGASPLLQPRRNRDQPHFGRQCLLEDVRRRPSS